MPSDTKYCSRTTDMRYLSILLLLVTFNLSAQGVNDLHPTLGQRVDKSPEMEIEFYKRKEKCSQLWKKRSDGLSAEEKKMVA